LTRGACRPVQERRLLMQLLQLPLPGFQESHNTRRAEACSCGAIPGACSTATNTYSSICKIVAVCGQC
jgi:hypothetical protein